MIELYRQANNSLYDEGSVAGRDGLTLSEEIIVGFGKAIVALHAVAKIRSDCFAVL